MDKAVSRYNLLPLNFEEISSSSLVFTYMKLGGRWHRIKGGSHSNFLGTSSKCFSIPHRPRL